MTISDLIERLEKATGPNFELERQIQGTLEPGRNIHVPLPYTASVDAAIELAKKVLPGWGWRVATCAVSDDAWVFPDFNSPIHGERLKRDVPMNIDWVDLTDVDLRPAGRPAIALCIAVLTALLAIKAHQGEGE